MTRKQFQSPQARDGAPLNDLDLLTPKQVADIMGLEERTLANWRSLGKGPRFFKPTAKTVLYSKAAIMDFLTRVDAQSGREARKKLLKASP